MKIRHIIIKKDEQKIEWSHEEAPCGLKIQNMQMKEDWQSPRGNQKPCWSTFGIYLTPFQLGSKACWPFLSLTILESRFSAS